MKALAPTVLLLVFSAASHSGFALPKTESSPSDTPATEAEMREAVRDVEQLTQTLQLGLKKYRQHLEAALYRQGYGVYHPLFRTSLNGFEQDQIDLDDLDEYKMGRFAFELTSAGITLNPDPFHDWSEIQKSLASFESRLNEARTVIARSHIIGPRAERNISRNEWLKLEKRWRSASLQAADLYEHAIAVRAVQFEGGEMVPARPTIRYIVGGGRYGVICGFGVCTSSPDTNNESRTDSLAH